MDLSAFQLAAGETSKLKLGGPQSAIAPLLGLASEAGSIVNVYKRYLRDSIDLAANREFLSEELGDLLWYAAAVATAFELDLGAIAEANLRRTRDRYPPGGGPPFSSLPVLDASYPDHERFPRRLVVEFTERHTESFPTALLTLVSAHPNPFPNGPRVVDGKQVGFEVGGRLGAPLTDNSRRRDDYRFHDALHMGFMATLGWSPTMRDLLRLKRKSNPAIDDGEDGARAIFAEEGLATVLSRLAERRKGFCSEPSVDGEAIVITKAAITGLEAQALPAWLWRLAINQGFVAMHELAANQGGYLIADLDERKLTYQKVLE